MRSGRMVGTNILYLGSPGKKNTGRVVKAVLDRLDAGGIDHVVVASSTGKTAEKFQKALGDSRVRLVVVTSHCGFEAEGECEMSEAMFGRLTEGGARVVRASHVLSGIERSVTRKTGGASRVEAISEALRALFGQGMKVCVEITVMAADSGAIPCGEVEVIAVGGTGWGADTACVVRPAHANSFFDFEVREILAMPRRKRSGKNH